MGANTSKDVREAYVAFWKKVFDLDARAEFGVVGAGSVLRCGLLCFLTYWAPLALLRRKFRDPHHLRSAVAFGLFGATYRTVRVLISRLASQDNESLHRHSPVLAGWAAAGVTVAVDPSFLNSVFVVWWVVRALRTLKPVREHVEGTKFGPLAVMAFSSAVLAPAGLKAPEEHHVSYRRFLQGYFECSGTPLAKFQEPDPGLTIGETVGGGHLASWFARYCVAVTWSAFKLYAPLHLVWALFRLPNLTDPRVIAANTGRSVAFLSTYVCGLMAGLLAHSHLTGGSTPRWQIHLYTAFPTVSLLLERPNRQAELAAFCAAHAVNSIYNHFRLRGVLKPNNFVGALLLMVATGRIMGEAVSLCLFSLAHSFPQRSMPRRPVARCTCCLARRKAERAKSGLSTNLHTARQTPCSCTSKQNVRRRKRQILCI
jgi:hypothetical protein